MNNTYCKYCGKKKLSKSTGYFNTQTGEPELEYYCIDDDKCSHNNHDYKVGFWVNKAICKKCGHDYFSPLFLERRNGSMGIIK